MAFYLTFSLSNHGFVLMSFRARVTIEFFIQGKPDVQSNLGCRVCVLQSMQTDTSLVKSFGGVINWFNYCRRPWPHVSKALSMFILLTQPLLGIYLKGMRCIQISTKENVYCSVVYNK